uniref:cytochrome c oxidase subunit II n=1 Tax=Dipterophagus daci TaxID=2800156 RepID=UPI001D10D4C4|nr:cytochrome c oxidase subunit II [Dipterophagus daci]QZO77414.1 cytochrome c oxidase subunit 2 [Dipterophagus daci]
MYYINIMDSASPIMNEILILHDHFMMICTMMTVPIMYLLSINSMKNFKYPFINNLKMEIMYSIIPLIFILLFIFPSMHLIFLMESCDISLISLKIMGNQWYWSYELKQFNKNFNSYMIPENEIKSPKMKFLEVNNKLILPYNIPIRLLASSSDVIHAWTIQNLGIKLDAIPGHLNQINLFICRPGKFLGQCSEICGINHSFMPIIMETINIKLFLNNQTN